MSLVALRLGYLSFEFSQVISVGVFPLDFVDFM